MDPDARWRGRGGGARPRPTRNGLRANLDLDLAPGWGRTLEIGAQPNFGPERE